MSHRARPAPELTALCLWVAWIGLTLGSCGGRHSSFAPPESLTGAVIDAQSGEPLERVTVDVCSGLSSDPRGLREQWPRCAQVLGSVLTDESGRFALSAELLKHEPVHLALRHPLFVARALSGERPELRRKLATPIGIDRLAQVSGRIIGGDGAPFANAGYGFVVQGAHGLSVSYTQCCSGRDGMFSLKVYDLSDQVWIFATTSGDTPSVGAKPVNLSPGQTVALELQINEPLARITGRTVATDGLPLACLVKAETLGSRPGPVELALLTLQGGETDPAGHFAFLTKENRPLRITASAWNGDHSTRELGRKDLPAADRDVLVQTNVPGDQAVTCSLLDGDTAVAVDELELSFGGTGVTVYAGGPATSEPTRTRPTEVRFAWPQGGDVVSVVARGSVAGPSESRDVQGGYVLRSPAEPCRIPASGSHR